MKRKKNKELYSCICPLCCHKIESKTRHTVCQCGLKIYIRKWTKKDYEEFLYPVFEGIAFRLSDD